MNNDFDICINKISIAHKFTMNKNEKCNYSKGRKYFGIAYFIAGQIKYDFSDGSSFLTEPGDIIFFNPFGAYIGTAVKTCEHFTINFSIETISESENAINDIFKGKSYLIQRETTNSYIEELFNETAEAWKLKSVNYLLKIKSTLYKILYFVLKQYNASEDTSYKNNMIHSVINYINQHFTESINIQSLAKIGNISISHFHRIFFEATGKTPSDYINDKKIEYAKELLQNSEFSIKQIAYSCGFADCNYFCRFFKKHLLITPKEFQNSCITHG